MSIVSLEFFALLAVTVALLFAAPAGARKAILLASSLLFYFSADQASAALGLAIVLANYAFLRSLVRTREDAARDRIYFASIGFNVLAFFALKLTFEPAPGQPTQVWDVAGLSVGYPLGLSFIILMLHAATSDAFSGKYVPARTDAGTFVLYGTFFPYVTAGPVERLDAMERQLDRPARPDWQGVRAGTALIAMGLFKKLAAAGLLQSHVSQVFDGIGEYSAPSYALAISLNAAFVYCDFSGYTDIARGSARCLGIDIRINFDRPFAARSVTEFWRRWHMSFSSWLRDYLYMPIAYSLRRLRTAGPVMALLLTFAVCGFWHRATWTFLLFGVLHGTVMAIELRVAASSTRAKRAAARPVRTFAAHACTLVFLVLSIVLFSADNLAHAGEIYAGLASAKPPSLDELMAYKGALLFAMMAGSVAIWKGLEAWQSRLRDEHTPWFLLAAATATLFLGQSEGGSFVYEQF